MEAVIICFISSNVPEDQRQPAWFLTNRAFDEFTNDATGVNYLLLASALYAKKNYTKLGILVLLPASPQKKPRMKSFGNVQVFYRAPQKVRF